MISLSGYLMFVVAFVVAVAVPGPSVATVVGRVLSHGAVAGLMATFGTAAGDIVWLTVAILGLATLAKTFAGVFLAIKYLGALYLLYLAWKLWTAPPQIIDVTGAKTSGKPFSSFWLGLSVALSNPKTIMFYMAILPTLIDVGHTGLSLYMLLVPTIVASVMVIFGGYILLTVKVRQVFREVSAIRALQRISGLVMSAAAAMIVAR